MLRPLSALDKVLQPAERVVPLFRDQLEISMHLCEALLFQLPDILAPVSRTAHETGVSHYAQVLGDRLTRDGKLGRQLRDRHRPIVAETTDETKPSLIAQRGKDRRRTLQRSGRPRTTRLGQDISRSASRPSSSRLRSP